MDIADIADEQVEIMLADALRRARSSPLTLDSPMCLNCEMGLSPGQRNYCDRDCRDDFEHRNRTRSKQVAA